MTEEAEVHFTAEMRAPVITMLLSLADNPRDVRTVGGKNYVRVPQELADKFNKEVHKPRRTRAKKKEEGEES